MNTGREVIERDPFVSGDVRDVPRQVRRLACAEERRRPRTLVTEDLLDEVI